MKVKLSLPDPILIKHFFLVRSITTSSCGTLPAWTQAWSLSDRFGLAKVTWSGKNCLMWKVGFTKKKKILMRNLFMLKCKKLLLGWRWRSVTKNINVSITYFLHHSNTIWSYFGSNEIHVTALQYSVTFLVLLMVFKYNFDTVLLDLVRYFWATVAVFVIDYFLQLSVIQGLQMVDYHNYFLRFHKMWIN